MPSEINQVEEITRRGMKLLYKLKENKSPKDEEIEEIIQVFTEMKGIGPATASALLAPLCPEHFPFMEQLVLEVLQDQEDPSKVKFTPKTYREFRAFCNKAKRELSKEKSGKKWTSEDVGRALWCAAKATTGGDVVKKSEDSVGRQSKRRKTKK